MLTIHEVLTKLYRTNVCDGDSYRPRRWNSKILRRGPGEFTVFVELNGGKSYVARQ